MAALAGAAVILTLTLLLYPTFLKVRSALARGQGARLVAVAESVTEQLPDDFVLALGWGVSDSVAVSPAVRDAVQRARVANSDVLGAGNELLSLDIVARNATGQFHYVLAERARHAVGRAVGTCRPPRRSGRQRPGWRHQRLRRQR